MRCHSVFIKSLEEICGNHKGNKKSSIGVRDLRGDELERVKKYFKKVAEINFSDQGELWKRIIILRKIRNSIVHDNSKIPDDREVGTFMEENANFFEKYSNDFEPTEEYCKFAIETYEEFVSELPDEVSDNLWPK